MQCVRHLLEQLTAFCKSHGTKCWAADIPLGLIRSVQPWTDEPEEGDLDVSVFGSGNVRVELRREVVVEGPFGITRKGGVIVMQAGKIVEMGPADAIYQSPEKDYTRTLIEAIPKDGLEHIERRQSDRRRAAAERLEGEA